jgi:hypothetical protein
LVVAPKYMKGRTTPRSDAERDAARAKARRRWQRVFADAPPGLSINAFCFRHQCDSVTARKWAVEFGYEFSAVSRRA